jgi:hypothetical protein
MRSGLVAAAVAGSVALVPVAASAQPLISATVPVSVTVPGPVGGSQTCLSPGGCINLQGVSDLSVTATVSINGLSVPVVTPASPPDCSGNVQAGATITPALGSGAVNITISYQTVNTNGAPVGAPTTVTKTIPFSAGGKPVTVTECASAL